MTCAQNILFLIIYSLNKHTFLNLFIYQANYQEKEIVHVLMGQTDYAPFNLSSRLCLQPIHKETPSLVTTS